MSIRVIYGRTDGSYLKIPLEMNLALELLEDEFKYGDAAGELVSRGTSVQMSLKNFGDSWERFKPRAVVYLRDLIKLANRENGYGYDRP